MIYILKIVFIPYLIYKMIQMQDYEKKIKNYKKKTIRLQKKLQDYKKKDYKIEDYIMELYRKTISPGYGKEIVLY